MKAPRLLLAACAITLLSGCAMFRSSRTTEGKARAAEARQGEFDRDQAIRSRAATYEKQGLSANEARAAAERESPGLRTNR
jgi:hypothetical protein